MKTDLKNLSLEGMAIHQVRRWREENGEDLPRPVLAKQVSKLGAEEREFLEAKIAQAAGGQKVASIQPSQYQVAKGNSNPKKLLTLLESPSQLIAISQALVEDLVQEQGKRGGSDYLVAIGHGKAKGRRVLILFTMNIEKGMRAILDSGGPPELKQVKDLVLDGKAQLNKMVALEEDGGQVTGIVEDSLVGQSDAAVYFLHDFLGFETTESARQQTKNFDSAVRTLINKHVTSQEDKVVLAQALTVEVGSQAENIDISEFRRKHVAPKYQPAFDAELEAKKLPKGQIGRDVTLLGPKKNNTTIYLSNGIVIKLPAGATPDVLESGEDKKGPFIKIRAKVEKVD